MTTSTFRSSPILALFIVIVFFHQQASSQDFETTLLSNINVTHPNSFFWKGMSSSVYPISLSLPTGILAIGYLEHDAKLTNKGWEMVGALAINTLVTQGLKKAIQRNRPYQDYPSLIHPEASDSDPSFPSGHTSTAFATATSISLDTKKWYIIAPAFAWATGVGYSRLYLGEHYPSDVLAGALIGSGSAWLSHWLNQRYFNRKK